MIKFCPFCGAKIIVGSFCAECGANLSDLINNAEPTIEKNRVVSDIDLDDLAKLAQQAADEKRAAEENLKRFHIFEDVLIEYIGEETEVVIPDCVAHIGRNAFREKKITRVTLPKSIESIDSRAFDKCNELKRVDFLGDIVDWCAIKFEFMSNPLEKAHDLYIGGKLVTEIVIPDGVTELSDYVFRGCTHISDVKLPKGLTRIGEFAFAGCTGLSHIDIPDSVTEIEWAAFEDCYRLTSVKLPSMLVKIGDYAFTECSGITRLDIPHGVTEIGEYAFCGCIGLTEISIPDSVVHIGHSAFEKCQNLRCHTEGTAKYLGNSSNPYVVLVSAGDDGIASYDFPNTVRIIYDRAFCDMMLSKTIYIPNSVTSIGYHAFSYGFEAIYLTESVKFIEESFSGCKNVNYDGTATSWVGVSLHSRVDGLKLCGEKPAELTVPSWVAEIPYGAFNSDTDITQLTITDGVKKICDSAFGGCDNLVDLVISGSVETIGFFAFNCCRNLTSLKIIDGVLTIDHGAFMCCYNLERIDLPDSLTNQADLRFIKDTTYYKNESNWHDGVLYCGNHLIGVKATVGGDFRIREGTRTIQYNAFENCIELTSVFVPDGAMVCSDVFAACENLKSISIPHDLPAKDLGFIPRGCKIIRR